MPIDQNTDTALPEILFTGTDNPTADHRIQRLAMNCFLSAGGHCETLARSVYHQRVYDWLDETLNHSRKN